MPKISKIANSDVSDEPTEFEKKIRDMSKEELRDLLLINTYKLALMKAQTEAITEILIKNKLVTYEEIWKMTNDLLKESHYRKE